MTIMKPLPFRQLVHLFNVMIADNGEEMMASGFEVFGIIEATKISLPKLPTHDHFKDISIVKGSINFLAILDKKTSIETFAVKNQIKILTEI